MIKSRALTSHTYNEETTQEILLDIVEKYYAEFKSLKSVLENHIANDE